MAAVDSCTGDASQKICIPLGMKPLGAVLSHHRTNPATAGKFFLTNVCYQLRFDWVGAASNFLFQDHQLLELKFAGWKKLSPSLSRPEADEGKTDRGGAAIE